MFDFDNVNDERGTVTFNKITDQNKTTEGMHTDKKLSKFNLKPNRMVTEPFDSKNHTKSKINITNSSRQIDQDTTSMPSLPFEDFKAGNKIIPKEEVRTVAIIEEDFQSTYNRTKNLAEALQIVNNNLIEEEGSSNTLARSPILPVEIITKEDSKVDSESFNRNEEEPIESEKDEHDDTDLNRNEESIESVKNLEDVKK